MRIALLIVLIISALSKKFVDIYKTEKQIQKEALYKCILNSNELRENIRVIYGDIQKAFINQLCNSIFLGVNFESLRNT